MVRKTIMSAFKTGIFREGGLSPPPRWLVYLANFVMIGAAGISVMYALQDLSLIHI